MISSKGFIFKGLVKEIISEAYEAIAYPENNKYVLYTCKVSPDLYLFDRSRNELHEVEIENPPFVLDKENENNLIAAYLILKGGQK